MVHFLKQRRYGLQPHRNTVILEECWQEIETFYCEEHRHYQNLDHIENLFACYDQYKQAIKKHHVVAYAIFYHDIIYFPGKNDNEEQSAAVAENALQQLRVPKDLIETVSHYIRATTDHHSYKDDDDDLKFFLDFDLSILSSTRNEYKKYLQNIRKEFAQVPDAQFRWGRSAYAQKWLQLPHLFFTEAFRAKEHIARENLRWELEEGLRHI